MSQPYQPTSAGHAQAAPLSWDAPDPHAESPWSGPGAFDPEPQQDQSEHHAEPQQPANPWASWGAAAAGAAAAVPSAPAAPAVSEHGTPAQEQDHQPAGDAPAEPDSSSGAEPEASSYAEPDSSSGAEPEVSSYAEPQAPEQPPQPQPTGQPFDAPAPVDHHQQDQQPEHSPWDSPKQDQQPEHSPWEAPAQDQPEQSFWGQPPSEPAGQPQADQPAQDSAYSWGGAAADSEPDSPSPWAPPPPSQVHGFGGGSHAAHSGWGVPDQDQHHDQGRDADHAPGAAADSGNATAEPESAPLPVQNDQDGQDFSASATVLGSFNQGGDQQPEPDALTIGRSRSNSIVLDDMLVSRQHVRITADDQGLLLEDLGSRNGTFVNGRRAESAHLQEGDRIGIGTTTFEVRDGWLVTI